MSGCAGPSFDWRLVVVRFGARVGSKEVCKGCEQILKKQIKIALPFSLKPCTECKGISLSTYQSNSKQNIINGMFIGSIKKTLMISLTP